MTGLEFRYYKLRMSRISDKKRRMIKLKFLLRIIENHELWIMIICFFWKELNKNKVENKVHSNAMIMIMLKIIIDDTCRSMIKW